jgi:hypothetical protein
VTVHDDIFPSERRSDYMQTEWATDWEAALSGFSYATKYLTEHRTDLGATIDQAGLALVFLQRHRVELALKVLLEAAGAPVPPTHSIRTLWDACEDQLSAKDPRECQLFRDAHYEFVLTVDAVDPGSFTFRYPVNRQGAPVQRPQFIDLDALERHGDDFRWGVEGFREYLSRTH